MNSDRSDPARVALDKSPRVLSCPRKAGPVFSSRPPLWKKGKCRGRARSSLTVGFGIRQGRLTPVIRQPHGNSARDRRELSLALRSPNEMSSEPAGKCRSYTAQLLADHGNSCKVASYDGCFSLWRGQKVDQLQSKRGVLREILDEAQARRHPFRS